MERTDKSELENFKEALNSVQSFLAEQSQRGIFQISDEVLSELQEQVDLVDTTHLGDQSMNYNGGSFTQKYDAMTRPRKGNTNFRLNQALTGNQKLSTDSDERMEMIWSELMKKLETLDENVKMLDNRVVENAFAIKSEIGRLHGSTDANPRCQVSAVLLRSGKRQPHSNDRRKHHRQ
ncbi:Uncharacterized protein Rs2_15828 [Raphanus sativus]|nr:Uncharacterized protein Rs2_15828 [Raphanus sativus]